MEINQRLNDKNINKRKPFTIRRRKTFLINKQDNSFFKSSSLKKNNSKRRSISNKRGFLLNLSLINYNNAEEEIKNALIEKRRTLLWELRRQSYDIISQITNDKKEENKQKTHKIKGRSSSKYLYSRIDDKIFESEKKKKKVISQSHIIKNNEYIKKYFLNDSEKKTILNNDTQNDKTNNCDNEKTETKTHSNLESSVNSKKVKKKKNSRDKFRFLSRGCLVIDSIDENESDEELEQHSSYVINPETNIFLAYDLTIVLCVLFSLFYFPYELAKYFCLCGIYDNIIKIIIDIFIDCLFIVDLIINFFLEYYTKEEEVLVKISSKIMYNYIFGWFFFDFLTTLPFNCFSYFYCNRNPRGFCYTYQKDNNIDFLLILRCLKAIKIFKVLRRKKNQFLTKICEKCSNNIILENILNIIRNIKFVIIALHIISCIHIYIGKHTFPGWINSNGFQNDSFIKIYMISIYYITTTLTTVGYGDIDSNSIIEIQFRIILLAFGIVGYSWIISSISNGINKENYASINFENDWQILEGIKRNHRKIPYSLYINIINHLKRKHFYQNKYDKNLLINSLPYSLKNNLIFSMYKKQIEKFDYFKNPSNSNFLVEVLSCFTPISAQKEDILLKENDLIEDIFFVREGKLALEISINIDNPEESINKYLSFDFLNFAFDFNPNQSYTHLPMISKSSFMGGSHSFIFSSNYTNLINSGIKKEEKHKTNSLYLRVHDIHKDEDYGDIFMAFRKRSPFAVRVKTRRVKLFVIKKEDFYKLYEQYKNVFRPIFKKKKHNFVMIKNILIKTLARFCNIKGIRIDEKYKETIKKATNALNKEIIPTELLKEPSLIHEINEIDEEINMTIKEFDHEFSSIKSSLNKEKRKAFQNIKKVRSSTIVTKKYILDDINNSSDYESRYYSSLLKSKIKKNLKKKIKKIKTKIKTNVALKEKFQDINFNFNFSESDDSIGTVKVKENDNIKSSGPRTNKTFPKSLNYSLKKNIKNQEMKEKNENLLDESNIFIYINNNCNYGKNIINNSHSNIINNLNNVKKRNRNSSSNVTFDNIFNYKNKEENTNSDKNKDISYRNKKTSLSSVSLYNMKKHNNLSFSNGYNHHKKKVKSSCKNINFDAENLFSTSADSFEIKSSYRNLNQASEGQYIKDQKLQENTIKYIKEYNSKNSKKNTKIEKHKRYNIDDSHIIKKNKSENSKYYYNFSKKKIKYKNKKNKNSKNNLDNLYISPKEKKSSSSKNIRSIITNKDLSVNSNNDNNVKIKEDNHYNVKYNDYTLDNYNKICDSKNEDSYNNKNTNIHK